MYKNFELSGCQQCESFHCEFIPSINHSRNLGNGRYLSAFDCVVTCDKGAFRERRVVLNNSTDTFPSIDEVLQMLIEDNYVPKYCPHRHCFVGKDSRNSVLLDRLRSIMRSYDIPEDTIFGVANAFGEELSKLN